MDYNFDSEIEKEFEKLKNDVVKEIENKDIENNSKGLSKLKGVINDLSNRTIKCPHCGMMISSSETICSNCGKKI